MNEVEFGVLGPLRVAWNGRAIALGPDKHRTLLACLLLRSGQVVPVSELVDRLWGEDPPAGGRRVIQTYVTRLRKALGTVGDLIRTAPHGYLLEVPDGALDLALFRAHLELARAAGDPHVEADELRSGLALWRGEPLADIASEALRRDVVPGLVEERLRALDRRIEVDLVLGRHAELISELSGLVREHPLRESLWAALMLALHRSDRRADALRAFQDVRELLRDELGLDPGEAVREAHEAILRSGSAPGWSPVRQLPADVATFVGRAELVAHIEAVLRSPDQPRVLVLSGPPGIGKTALALRAAHRLAGDFPDGQLYVNLRGHSGTAPMPAGDALVRMLRAVGIPPDRIPTELDEQSALFRSTVAGRRILVVLDNAVGPEHVRPLLPGSRSCPVIVTSRDNLRGLTAINSALRLPVDVLTDSESVALLAGIAGTDRIAAEPVAAQKLAELAGRLPLALRIAAANLVDGPHRTVAEYAEHLSGGNRVGALEIDGDDQSAVRVAFGLSYGMLKPDLARLFRLLSCVPGPDFDGYVAANLAQVPLDTARTMLDRLATANLIAHEGAGRYQFHDLIRDYAAALAEESDTEAERAAAYRRMLHFYCHTTDSVAELVYPEWLRLPVSALPTDAPRPDLNTVARGIRWLDEERANMVAAIREADPQLADLGCPLAAALVGYLLTQRHDSDWLTTVTKALAVAERAGDHRTRATMRLGLGLYHFTMAEMATAGAEYERAVELFRQGADILGEGRAISNVAVIMLGSGQHTEAAEHLERALAKHRQAGDRAGECLTLYRLGCMHLEYGPGHRAVDQLSEAVALSEELGFKTYGMNTAYSRGLALIASGDPASAIADFDAARRHCLKLGFEEGEADVLSAIASAQLALGQVDQALEHAERALSLSRKVTARIAEISALLTLGAAHVQLARAGEARAYLVQARELAEDAGMRVELMRANTLLAACHRLDGDYELALRALPEATSREPWCGPALTELARIRLAMGQVREAIAGATEAAEICRDHGYRPDEAQALAVLAEAMKQE